MSLSELIVLAITLTLTLGAAGFEHVRRGVPEALGGIGLGVGLGAHALLGGPVDLLAAVLGVLLGASPWFALRDGNALGGGRFLLAAAFGAALRAPGALVLTGLGLVLWAGLALAPRFGIARADVGRGLSEARPATLLGVIATIQALRPLWVD